MTSTPVIVLRRKAEIGEGRRTLIVDNNISQGGSRPQHLGDLSRSRMLHVLDVLFFANPSNDVPPHPNRAPLVCCLVTQAASKRA
jgi:hypothetical protein